METRWLYTTSENFPALVEASKEVCVVPLGCVEKHGLHLPLGTDENGPNKDDLKEIAAALWSKGVENVVITLGGSGSAVVGADSIRYIPCVQMPHVADPTAAGDSFVGALSVGLSIGLTQEQALAFASHTAAITVSRMGAMPSLPRLEEVILLLEDRSYDGFDLSVLDSLK